MNTIAAVIMYFFVALVMEFLLEKKLHIKERCIKKAGSALYVILVFGIAIVLIILLDCISSKILENAWVKGALLGLWIFSLININHMNEK